MDSCKGLDMNVVASSSVSGSQDGIATATIPAPSGRTPTGRVAQHRATVIQTPHQLAVTSNTPKRTTTDYAVTVTTATWPAKKVALAGKSKTFEIQECEYKPTTNGLREAIQESLSKLKGIWQEKMGDPVLLCTAVTEEMDQLKKQHKINNVKSKDYKYMACQLGPYYADTLHPALEVIQHQDKNGHGWEYHGIIGSIGKYLNLQTSDASDSNDNVQLLKDIHFALTYKELDYLNFMKDFPLEYTVRRSATIIGQLLSTRYGAQGYQWISDEEVNQINSIKDRAILHIRSRIAEGGADKDIDKLEEDMRRETDDKKIRLMERRYHDILRDLFIERKAKYNELKHTTTTEYVSFITDLSELLVKCKSRISELHLLPNSIKEEIICETKKQLNNHLYRGVRLDEKILKLVEDILDNTVENEKCGRLCLYCKELEFPPQDVMRTPVREDRITGCQFKNKLAEIVFIQGNKPEAKKAADKLRELFHEHAHEIRVLDIKDPDMNQVINFRKSLHKELFMPLVETFYKLQNQEGLDNEKFAEANRRLRSELVELIPYTFILVNEKERADLTNLACTVWYGDVEELSQKTLFREKDIDCLLELKRISPHIPDQSFRAALEKALANIFQFVLRDTGEIPVGKIAILSQWVDGLNRVKRADEQLRICNEQWKDTNNKGAVNKSSSALLDIPSTSASVFDIDQAISESVALRKKMATARVPSDQSIPDVTFSQPASEEPLTSKKSRSSLAASTKKMSEAKASRASVISSESRAEIGKDQSSSVGFSGSAEQLATAGMAMITAPLSQATPSLLQRANQLPFKTGENEPQSTVTVPVEMAVSDGMESHAVDMTAENPGAWEIPEGIPPPVKTQADRCVYGATAIQTQHKRMKASSGFLPPDDGDNYAVAVQNPPAPPWKTVTTGESSSFEIVACKYQPTDRLQTKVKNSLETLKREQKMPGTDAWSFCLAVAKEIRRLEERLKNKYNLKGHKTVDDCKSFIRVQLGPYYVENLRPALDIIMHKAENDCGWEYYRDIGIVARYLDIHPDNSPDQNKNKELVKKIYLRIANSELHYLEFMRDHPFKNTAQHSKVILERLLSGKNGAVGIHIMTKDQAKNIHQKADKLIKALESNYDKGGDKKTDKLKEDVYSGDAGSMVRRRYNDFLREEFKELKHRCMIQNISIKEQISILERLFELYIVHKSVLGDLYSLPCEIIITITKVIKEKMKKSLNSGVRLEEEILDFADNMRDRDIVSKECRKLCLCCKELPHQTRKGMTAQTDKITADQYKKQIDEIRSLLDTATNHDLMIKAADMLKQLLCQYGHEIEALDIGDPQIVAIKKIRRELSVKLFKPFHDQFNKYKEEMADEELAKAMSKHRTELDKLLPYAFFLDNDAERDKLIKIVHAAWHCDAEELSKVTSFQERHVDCLLGLKRIMPHTPNLNIRITIENALIQFFQCVNKNGIGKIPVEKVVALSQWVDGLIHLKRPNEQLKTLNEEWKKTKEGAMNKKDMPLTSIWLFEQVYSAFSRHSKEGYLAAAKLLGSIDIEQSSQKADFEIIRSLIGKKLFMEVFDVHSKLVKKYQKDDPAISRELYKFKDVFLQNKDILFVLENDEQRDVWKKCACIAWKETMQALIKKDEYSDEDLREMVYVSEVAADLPDPELLAIVQKAIRGIFTYWNSQVGKDKLSRALMNKISDWTDRVEPDQKALWNAVPVEVMTASDNVDIEANNHSIQETQEGILSPEKTKTQTERVANKAEAIQIPSQMASASSTSRQTGSDDCAMAIALADQ